MTASTSQTTLKPVDTRVAALASLKSKPSDEPEQPTRSTQPNYVEMAQAHAKQPPRYSN